MFASLTRPALASVLCASAGALALSQEAPQAPAEGGPSHEPPLEVRVTLGGETVDVVLGREGTTADGRPLRVELLPSRTFRVPGAFAFDYPRQWRFSGSLGADGVGAWWTLGGDGRSVYLRRHSQDAQEILEQYLTNLSASGALGERRRTTVNLGGRELEGWAVEIEVGNIGPGEPHRWVQEVFAWTQEEGVSWLVSLQRDLGPMNPTIPTGLGLRTRYNADGTLELIPFEVKLQPEPPAEWPEVLTGFTWE